MTKETMIKNYRKFSAADSYVIGFIYKHEVYMVEVDEIMPRYMSVERESSKNGHAPNLRLRLSKKYKEQLLRKGAICLGGEELVCDSKFKNKGVQFEKMVSEIYGIPYKGKDSVPFYVQGDISVNGKEIQIKFENASIVTSSTLERLKKGKRKKYKTA